MNEAHEDQQLILAAQQDPQAFAVLYEKYIDRMYQFLYFRTGQNPETAEDMTAELFTRAFTQLSRFSWQGYPYSAYLYQVARSLCVDYYRKHAIVVDVDALELQDDRSDTVMTQMDIQLLWKKIGVLPKSVQEMLELRYIEDLSFEEIGHILGKKSGAIRTAVSRAIDRLQKEYEI